MMEDHTIQTITGRRNEMKNISYTYQKENYEGTNDGDGSYWTQHVTHRATQFDFEARLKQVRKVWRKQNSSREMYSQDSGNT